MKILGIETSCDETGVAIYDDNVGLIINKLHTQEKLHKKYGGVVPELASRNHINKLIYLIKSALQETKISKKEIKAIAYTAGPGLVGSLLVGATIAHSLSFSWKIPVLPINHLEGHLMAPMLENEKIQYPIIALLVSGGHTQLIKMNKFSKYDLIGESIDDAAGEAFDKIATLLGLGYPGGPIISEKAKNGKTGKFIFPRPMLNQSNLNFSFSGLKTSVKKIILKNKNNMSDQKISDISLAFEESIIDVLIYKSKKALIKTGIKNIIITGGVSANNKLRLKMEKEIKKIKGKVFYPKLEFCKDNGAMIALTGMIRIKKKKKIKEKFIVKSNWKLKDLN